MAKKQPKSLSALVTETMETEGKNKAPEAASSNVVDLPSQEPAQPKNSLQRTSLYLHRGVHRYLKELALHEEKKVQDLINEGIELLLEKRGAKTTEELIDNYNK